MDTFEKWLCEKVVEAELDMKFSKDEDEGKFFERYDGMYDAYRKALMKYRSCHGDLKYEVTLCA